jgi:glyoxylase-like metal-dependent hydrolase (beta-lactamase superfamily II)
MMKTMILAAVVAAALLGCRAFSDGGAKPVAGVAESAQAPEKGRVCSECVRVGCMDENCYLVWAAGAESAVVIDPGADAEKIEKALAAHKLKPVAVLLTHAHPDHLGAAGLLAEKFKIPVWVHERDLKMYRVMAGSLPSAKLPEPVKELPVVPGLRFTVLETPGHTLGGVCFYFADAATLFVGDTLFRHGVGRTDLAGGNEATLLRSIQEKLLPLPPATKVCPGHGTATTIGAEAAENPFLAEQ